jgi:hypothetical protein
MSEFDLEERFGTSALLARTNEIKMNMAMATTSWMTPSAAISMAMPTITSEVVTATMTAMSMSIGDTGGCRLSVSAVHPDHNTINTSFFHR